MRRRSFLAFALAACAQPPPREPVLVAAVDEYPEGPVFDAAGNFFFTHDDFVSKITQAGERSIWVKVNLANGHKVLPSGEHLLCEQGAKRVIRLDPDGNILGVAANQCQGEPLRAPNDLTLSLEGGWYFTDPGGSRQAPIGTVHFVDPAGNVRLAAGGLRVPNGLVLSPDGRTLYVAETVPNRVLAYPVDAPGELGAMQVFAELPGKPDSSEAGPDGMTVDAEGRLYVAHLGMSAVQVLSPAGDLLETLPGGGYDVSNVAFAPGRYDRLWITSAAGPRSQGQGRVCRLDLS